MTEEDHAISYDRISRIYDVSRGVNIETVRKLARLLNVSSDSVFLDLGCGTGNYTAALQGAAKSLVGIDISKGMIEQAQAKFPETHLVCGDVTSLPFDSNTFDGAFAIQLLHHLKKKEIFFKEAHRVLRKGGCLAIHSCSHRQLRSFWFYHYFPQGLKVDLARIPDSSEITLMFERAEFSNIGIEVCYKDEVVTHERPQSYLDKNYRNSISTFALLSQEDIEAGCRKLQEDIRSGFVEHLVTQSKSKVTTVGGTTIVYGKKESS